MEAMVLGAITQGIPRTCGVRREGGIVILSIGVETQSLLLLEFFLFVFQLQGYQHVWRYLSLIAFSYDHSDKEIVEQNRY